MRVEFSLVGANVNNAARHKPLRMQASVHNLGKSSQSNLYQITLTPSIERKSTSGCIYYYVAYDRHFAL